MPWDTETDLERIRRTLRVPAEKIYLDIIRTSMSRVERESPASIATIQELLTEFEGNRKTTKALRGDASYAMTRADVIEWSPGQRDSGLQIDKEDIRQEIATALFLQLPEQSSNGYTSRS